MKLSVALCTFNGMPYLPEMLESLLNQEVPVFEIVVGDDGSTDGSLAYLEKMAIDPAYRLRIIKNEMGLGAKKNFEVTMKACTGDIIFLADQDDCWFSGKTKIVLEFFENHSSAAAVFSNAVIMNAAGKLTGKSIWETFGFSGSGCSPDNKDGFFLYQILNPSLVTGATMAFRRKELENSYPFFTPQHYWHDYWLGLFFAAQSKLFAINEPLMKYREHDAQQTTAGLHHSSTADIYRLAWENEIKDPDYDQILLEHFAHAYTRLNCFKPQLLTRSVPMLNIHKTEKIISEKLKKRKVSVLKKIPFFSRKLKMLKHWLKGGEYLQISVRDMFTI